MSIGVAKIKLIIPNGQNDREWHALMHFGISEIGKIFLEGNLPVNSLLGSFFFFLLQKYPFVKGSLLSIIYNSLSQRTTFWYI